MTTAVIYHDTPIAERMREQVTDLTVVDADSAADVRDALADAEILVTNPTLWAEDYLDVLSAEDWVQTTSIGYQAFPVAALADRGVDVTNAATVHDSVVSEHALALALALSRRLGPSFDRQRTRTWDRQVGDEMWDWKGRQMTVFGLGNIGEAVARRGQAFGMDVCGVKRSPSVYTGVLARDRVVGNDELSARLPETDLLVVTVPLTDDTRHAIDAETFARLPDEAVLVNVGRGAVVDQDALLTALETGAIGGAGLDVFEDEPLPEDSPLWDRDDVVVTPHVGGRSRDFPDRFTRLFVDNYERWRDGRSLINRVA